MPLACATALGLMGLASSANATTYQLDQFPFVFMDATGVVAHLETSALGTFADPASIEGLLNASAFVAQLNGPGGALTTLDNSNASWSVSTTGVGAGVRLTVGGTSMGIAFRTPRESSAAALILASNDGLSVFQFRQENNVSDYSFVGFEYNAAFSANYSVDYGTGFAAPALAVSEPQTILSFVSGLVFLAALKRRAA